MRHARENPELYEDPDYSLRDQLLRRADDERLLREADELSPCLCAVGTGGTCRRCLRMEARANEPKAADAAPNEREQ